ncbi:Centromere protein Q [Heterocephalus glaber]|uniref:Centromere protein Q n=1 Tax=Heterocephalus glaber TaxID=10181 RepID=G5C573_HETGA|nr:Centromere protein Q [Heterocephalus glaber]
MPGKANASKKKSQQLKKKSKRKIDDEEVKLSEKEVRSTIKKSKNHPKHMSSEGQTNHINLKQIKIASNKRKTWQPLSKSVREHFQTMMEAVIIAILSNKIKEKEQIQYPLNCLKKRLLQLCETLKALPQKLKYLTNVTSILKMERAQDRDNEEGPALLQEEIYKIVQTVEAFSAQSEITHTEERSFDANSKQNVLLKDLDVLLNSSQMKNMSVFIEEAYKKLNAS